MSDYTESGEGRSHDNKEDAGQPMRRDEGAENGGIDSKEVQPSEAQMAKNLLLYLSFCGQRSSSLVDFQIC